MADGDRLAPLSVITFSRPLAVLAAERLGFFREAGLEVHYTITRGSVEQIRGLLAGRFDVAHTAADNVMAYNDREAAGLRVVWVGDLGLGQKLFVQPEIPDYASLRGAQLGVDALDTGYAFVLRKMLSLHGLEPDAYQLVSVGGTRERFQALREKTVAGGLLSAPYDTAAEDAGFRLLDPASRYFPNYPGLTVAVTEGWLSQHKELLQRYLAALRRGMAYGADPAHRLELVRFLAADQGVNEEAALRRYEAERAVQSRVLPSLAEVLPALQGVRTLRNEMTGVLRQVEESFDASAWPQ